MFLFDGWNKLSLSFSKGLSTDFYIPNTLDIPLLYI